MSRNNKYRLQIFKQLKRGNYIITPVNVYKTISFSSNQYLNKFTFLNEITFFKQSVPLNCEDFYENGYDCDLINTNQAIVINWVYGNSITQNKGIYSILLTKDNDGACQCLYLGYSKKPKTEDSIPFPYAILSANYFPKSEYPIGKIPYNSDIYEPLGDSQTIDPYILYSSIDHAYYKNKPGESDINAGYYIRNTMHRALFESASVFTISQNVFGSGIKRGSLEFTDRSLYNLTTESIAIYDDAHGNLILNTIDTSSFISSDLLLLYLSFDEKFKSKIDGRVDYTLIQDYSPYKNNAITLSGSRYSDGFFTTGIKQNKVGTSLICGTSTVYVNHADHLALNNDDDFSISFYISGSIEEQTPNNTDAIVIGKQQYATAIVKNKFTDSIDSRMLKTLSGVYPFSVKYITSGSDAGKLRFSRYGGTNEAVIISNTIITGSFYHVVCQKSGSQFEIYINGTLDASGSADVNGSVYNTSPIFIGGLYNNENLFVGNIDEIRIYKNSLSFDEISALANRDFLNLTALQSNIIGNVFYNTGKVIVTSANPIANDLLRGLNGDFVYEQSSINYGFSGRFKSTKKIYQHEIVIPIRSHEYNFSSNPTLKINNNTASSQFKPFVSSSAFNVYFTTIGLYNRNYELVAVAKTATPIPKYQDKDINIIVRFDVE